MVSIKIPKLQLSESTDSQDDSPVDFENNNRLRILLDLNRNQWSNRRSVGEINFYGSLGSGGSGYNQMQLFFDHFIVGSDTRKVAFFNQLAENNETLTNIIINKEACIDEINKIIDFL